MKKIISMFLIVSAVLLLPFSVLSSGNPNPNVWKLDKDKDGFKTYSRYKNGSFVKEFRSVLLINYPMEVLLEVIIDVPSYPKWMPDCLEATILKEFHKGLERGNYYIHLTLTLVVRFILSLRQFRLQKYHMI